MGLVAVGGIAVLPSALPSLVDGMSQNPWAPVFVGASWLLATVSAIVGKRFIAAGHLGWLGATTAHIGGTVTNRVVPGGVGAAGVFLAALRKGGASTTAAAAVVALWAAAGAVAHVGGLIFGAAWLQGGAPLVGVVILASGALALTGPSIARQIGRAAKGVTHRWRVPPWRRPHAKQSDSSPNGVVPGDPTRRRTRQTIAERVRHALSAAGDVVAAARARPVMAAGALAAQVVAMLCLAVGFATAVNSFGVPVSVAAGMASYAAGTALSATVPTPAGIGSTEATLVGALVVAGATVSEALPTVLLFRAVILLAPVIVAALIAGVWLATRRRMDRTAPNTPLMLQPATPTEPTPLH
ncbi:hypothetical protein G1H11_13045 [Phytoactinopolyspora alkaliphila]|uniref:Flippase-like domain-containing protein n=1 Tax=Phytoactinopolyspora alkaliphila TaxID=1783498 RepID=A0A6N9YN11_9ACTN|nr:hypothetical protein [Phytoactinopolyspora alkaliphila]